MWTKCGCYLPPVYEEEPIPVTRSVGYKVQLKRPKINLDDLKRKIISDTKGVLKKLECGIQSDLELILEEISIIEI